MKKLGKMKLSLLAIMAFLSITITSCWDGVDNSYTYTVSTFATVTSNGKGDYKLYLDEGRGILKPDASTNINWVDTKRSLIQYNIPIADSVGENTVFTSKVVYASKMPVMNFVDVTGLTSLPDSLGSDVVTDFYLSAYRGFININTVTEKNGNDPASLHFSYDQNKFKGDTLFLNLHYGASKYPNSSLVNYISSFEVPGFVREGLTADSLCIAVTGLIWNTSDQLETRTVTRTAKLWRRRLTPPTYDAY